MEYKIETMTEEGENEIIKFLREKIDQQLKLKEAAKIQSEETYDKNKQAKRNFRDTFTSLLRVNL
jgi:hypothetical protein